MKGKFFKWASGLVLVSALVFGVASCSKDSDDDTTEQNGVQNNQDGQNGNGQNGNGQNGGGNGDGNAVIGNHAYIDLGLPSKTLWATCNIGATKPEVYGSYYAWGETATKDAFSLDNSKWWSTSYDTLMAKGVIDANGNLTAKYDAASANWGSAWRMPTFDEIKELLALENECVEVNGVKGRRFIGSNGNSLFLPFTGDRSEGELNYAGVYGIYWSATADENDWYAYGLGVYSDGATWDYGHRYWGHTVRPVLRTK